MNDKMTIAIGLIVAMLVLAGLAVWGFSSGMDQVSLLTIPVVSVLTLGALYLLYVKGKSLKEKLPMGDEMSKKAAYRSGYYAFFVSIYSGLAVGFFEESLAEMIGQEVLFVGQGTGIVILASALAFMVSMIYFTLKGVAE